MEIHVFLINRSPQYISTNDFSEFYLRYYGLVPDIQSIPLLQIQLLPQAWTMPIFATLKKTGVRIRKSCGMNRISGTYFLKTATSHPSQ